MSLINDFIEVNFGYEILDLLETYESLYNDLDIHIEDYDSLYRPCTGKELQAVLNKRILEAAQEEGIIPENWDLEEHFDLDGHFAIINDNEFITTEEMHKVIKDFKDWCNIKLEIVNN